MGAWDGLSEVEIEAEYPQARDGLLQGQWHFHGPGGERFDGFQARVAAVMAEIAADPVAIKLVVAHGVVSKVARGLALGLSQAAMLALPVPQDGFHVIGPDGVRFVGC